MLVSSDSGVYACGTGRELLWSVRPEIGPVRLRSEAAIERAALSSNGRWLLAAAGGDRLLLAESVGGLANEPCLLGREHREEVVLLAAVGRPRLAQGWPTRIWPRAALTE